LTTAVDRRNSEIALLHNRMKHISSAISTSLAIRETEWIDVQTSSDKIKEDINKFALSLVSEIECLRDKLIGELDSDVQYRNKKLDTARASAATYQDLSERINDVLNAFETCQDTVEFFSISQKLIQRLRTIIAGHPDIMPIGVKSKQFNPKTAFLGVFKTSFAEYKLSPRLAFSPCTSKGDSNLPLGRSSVCNDESLSSECLRLNLSGINSPTTPGLPSQLNTLETKTNDLKAFLQENIKTVQSLQLDITKRKSYPRRLLK
jgi:hypothetical protein